MKTLDKETTELMRECGYSQTTIISKHKDPKTGEWINSPRLDVAAEWLRKYHDIVICVHPDEYAETNDDCFVCTLYRYDDAGEYWSEQHLIDDLNEFELPTTYENAMELGIKRALNLIMEHKKA